MRTLKIELTAVLDDDGKPVEFHNVACNLLIFVPKQNRPANDAWMGQDGRQTFAGTDNEAAGWLLGQVVRRLAEKQK